MNRAHIVVPLAILVSVLAALGQAALKHAMNGLPSGGGLFDTLGWLLRDAWFYLGVAVTGSSTVLWLYVLSRAEMSYVTPFVGLGIVVSMLASVFLLHEQVGLMRLVGALVVAIGVTIVARS